MKVQQFRRGRDGQWSHAAGPVGILADAQLVLIFAASALVEDATLAGEARRRYPDARIVTCSTGGEITGTTLTENASSITALRFDGITVRSAMRRLDSTSASHEVGLRLGQDLAGPDLRHVLVFSEGLTVNGSALSAGVNEALPEGVAVTGGLAGDGDRFRQTVVGLDDDIGPNRVVAIGLYGDGLRVGMGTLGGWEMFGPDRVITRSDGNVLYELDGEPALDMYRRLLGPHAYGLPATGLLYPLNVRVNVGDTGLVRTILSIDEEKKSVTFAGDVPEGRHARLMRANLDRLIEASGGAAMRTIPGLGGIRAEFALLVSCIGRKLVLQQRAVEELRSARAALGDQAVLGGFYSYGEISPLTPDARCDLHNQTMTITTFAEA